MKLAPLSAAAALFLLILGIAVSKPTTSDSRVLPLDFSGIDTLRIIEAGESASIKISDELPARASFKDLKKNTITISRDGNSMTIRTNLHDYGGLDVVVPSKVRTFVVGAATIRSEARLDQVDVRASRSITWEGDIRELRIEAVPPRRQCMKDCGLEVQIGDGNIGRIEVRAPGGAVNFVHPDKIGAADLYLGQNGKVTLFNATRLGHIVMRDSESH